MTWLRVTVSGREGIVMFVNFLDHVTRVESMGLGARLWILDRLEPLDVAEPPDILIRDALRG